MALLQNTFILAIYNRLLTEDEKAQTELPDTVDPDELRVTQSAVFENQSALDEFLIDPELSALNIDLLTQFKINDLGHIIG